MEDAFFLAAVSRRGLFVWSQCSCSTISQIRFIFKFGQISSIMPTSRFEPSSIKNKLKREEISRKNRKAKNQQKLQKRLAQVKLEANDPAVKKVFFENFSSGLQFSTAFLFSRNV
jgi:hypothetical protein